MSDIKIRRLMVIEPHPDDYILMCGATARKLIDKEAEVYVVTFTNSGATFADKEKHRLERSEESARADKILGTTAREILEFETRESWDKPSKIYNALLERIRKIQPDTIITMHYDRRHPDHMWISQFIEPLVYQASENIRPDWGESIKARVLIAENPRSQLTEPNSYIDVTGTYQSKEEALREQTSQLDILGPRIFQDMKVLAEYRAIGMPEKVKYCEAFKEIPIHKENELYEL